MIAVVGCEEDGGRDVGMEDRCACVEALASESLSSDAIAALPEQINGCLHDESDGLEAYAAACLPVTLGTDARNDLDVVASYFCSDVCPEAGDIVVSYEVVAEADCCATGGVPNYDFAWGGYIGCFPAETPGGEAHPCE